MYSVYIHSNNQFKFIHKSDGQPLTINVFLHLLNFMVGRFWIDSLKIDIFSFKRSISQIDSLLVDFLVDHTEHSEDLNSNDRLFSFVKF